MLNARIASPCSANWDQMPGDNRVRHCAECNLHVFNFSEMTSEEIERLVAETTGRLCARFYQRPDGKMLTKNCPVGVRAAVFRASSIAAAVLTAAVSLAPKNAGAKPKQISSSLVQIATVQNTLTLQVLDPLGAAISNASVTLVDEKSKKTLSAVTGADGKLSLSGVPAGSYDLSVNALGFSTSKLTHLRLPSPETITVRLQLGALMGEVVSISAEEPSKSAFGVLQEPTIEKRDGSSKTAEHHNVLQRFFLRIVRLF